MSDDVTIVVRVGDQTAAGFRDINGRLRDLNGRFAAAGNDMRRSSSAISQALVDVKASMLSLAPAAVPVAAAMAPIASGAAGAGVALAAFGAAVVPQIANLKDASDAQGKYTDAVAKYGAQSKQAITAQQQAAQVMAGMPKATQQAAAAYMNLKEQFREFSDSTARFTMAPVEKSFVVLGQIIPKLKPMAEGTATQLDRLMTVAGGAVNTSGFDALSEKVSDFANNSLKNATDKAIHFMRVMSEGNASGPMASFFEYARQQGPAVKELLSNLAQAAGNLAQGAAQAGPGLLSVVNALAKMVAAVPPEFLGDLMQVYAAFKLITLAGAGIAAVGGGIQTLAGKIATLQAASMAAGGGLAGLQAAFATLGTAAKATIVVAGIAAVVLVMQKLSSIGKQAPPDVDRMSTSLAKLGDTGKVSGEALRVFGKDLGGLADSLRLLSRPSNLDKTQQFLTSLIGMDSTPVKEAKENLNAVDDALAGMVKGGKADLAKVAFEDIAKAMEKQGLSTKELKGKLDAYKSALADQALEQKLAAESMGLLGQAAQDTQAKLDAQKQSADGLRQSIQALNDVNRQGLGGMIGFEAAVDAAAQAAKDNAGALSMNHGVLDLNSEKARNAASALQDLADKTDSAAASARESGASWETVNGIYERGRQAFIDSAMAMGLSRSEATQLARSIAGIPDKKSTQFEMRTEDAITGLNSVIAAMKKTPDAKSVKIKALTADAVSLLRSLGLTVKQMPDGSFTVTAKTGTARSAIAAVQRARDGLKDKTINLSARDRASATARAIQAAIDKVRGKSVTITTVHQTLGVEGTAGRQNKNLNGFANGGLVRRYAEGGPITGGSGTQDDVPLLAMGGEFIINKRQTRKFLPLLEAINEDRVPGFKKGGLTSAEKDARGALRGQFGISSFGRAAGYSRTPFEKNLGAPSDIHALVSSLNQVAGQIRAAFRGKTESSLLKQLNSVGKSLISYEKQLNKVNGSLEKARGKLDDLKSSASQLSSSVKGGVLSSANITRGASGDGPVTVASIMGGLTASRDKATAFAGALKDLKAKGLSSALLQQVAEAGIEGGGLETAGALLQASGSEINSLNSLQSQIAGAASAAGKTTADAVYGAAIKAQEQLISKLQKQQDKLEKAMASLAKVMEKAISKALGKKASGGIVGAAASGGVRGGLTWVGEHEPELLQLPVGSRVWSGPDSRRKAQEAAPWASMLNSPRRAPTYTPVASPAAGGTDRPIVIQLAIGKQQFGEVWVEVGRDQVRSRGSIEATLKPPRTR